MKKVTVFLFLGFFSVGVFFAYHYYTDTYISTEAYAKIPDKKPLKKAKTDVVHQNGKKTHSLKYTLTFVKRNGDLQTVDYELSEDQTNSLKPGSFIKATISHDNTVASPEITEESAIPAALLAKINKYT